MCLTCGAQTADGLLPACIRPLHQGITQMQHTPLPKRQAPAGDTTSHGASPPHRRLCCSTVARALSTCYPTMPSLSDAAHVAALSTTPRGSRCLTWPVGFRNEAQRATVTRRGATRPRWRIVAESAGWKDDGTEKTRGSAMRPSDCSSSYVKTTPPQIERDFSRNERNHSQAPTAFFGHWQENISNHYFQP